MAAHSKPHALPREFPRNLYPVVPDNGTVAATFGKIPFIPMKFIIDPNGNVVDEHTGTLSKAQFESRIKPYLKKGV